MDLTALASHTYVRLPNGERAAVVWADILGAVLQGMRAPYEVDAAGMIWVLAGDVTRPTGWTLNEVVPATGTGCEPHEPEEQGEECDGKGQVP